MTSLDLHSALQRSDLVARCAPFAALGALLAVLLLAPGPATAQELAWKEHWRRVSWPEALVIAGSAGGTYLVKSNFHALASARWQGGVLLDDLVAGLLAADEETGRELSSTMSDYLLLSLIAYPSAIDPVAGAWFGQGSADVALQTSVISTQSLAANFFVASLTKALVGRLRPLPGTCGDEATSDAFCPDPRIGSFFSSHASLAFTAAGLVCAHHRNLPLYGGGSWDDVACFGSLGLAATTGALRLVSNNHYLSDVLVGSVVGIVSGLVIPELVYYTDDDTAEDGASAPVESLPNALQVPAAPQLLRLQIPLP